MSGYRTRLRARVERESAKFDEIFAAVVQPSRSSFYSESDSNSSFESDSSSVANSFSSIETKAALFVCPSCNSSHNKHASLHAHIALEHGKSLICCPNCNATSRTLWKTNVCRICKAFTSKLREHEAAHYQDKEGKGAIFECPHCYRSFNEFVDLKKHISSTHEKHNKLAKDYGCQVCGSSFNSRHQRDQHLVSHFHSYLDSVNNTTNGLDFLQSNQCPICHLALSSLRTFRLHVIYRHLLRDVSYSIQFMSGRCDPKEEPIAKNVKGEEINMDVKPTYLNRIAEATGSLTQIEIKSEMIAVQCEGEKSSDPGFDGRADQHK